MIPGIIKYSNTVLIIPGLFPMRKGTKHICNCSKLNNLFLARFRLKEHNLFTSIASELAESIPLMKISVDLTKKV